LVFFFAMVDTNFTSNLNSLENKKLDRPLRVGLETYLRKPIYPKRREGLEQGFPRERLECRNCGAFG
jgi:hypothetical protein